jgi:arginyl-tRNA synthetase
MSRFAQLFAERLAPVVELPAEQLRGQIGAPPRPELGHLAFGCFALAKSRRAAPAAIAQQIGRARRDGRRAARGERRRPLRERPPRRGGRWRARC